MILTCQETMSEYFRVVLCKTVQTIKLTEQVSWKLFGCLAKFCSSWPIVSKWLNNKTRYIIENKLIEISRIWHETEFIYFFVLIS